MNLRACDVFCTKGRRSLGSGQSLQGWVIQGSEGFVQSSRAPLWYHSPHWPFCVEISSDFHWIQRDGQESLSNTTRKFSVHHVWLDITEHFTPFPGLTPGERPTLPSLPRDLSKSTMANGQGMVNSYTPNKNQTETCNLCVQCFPYTSNDPWYINDTQQAL